jgi:hypothetical protein
MNKRELVNLIIGTGLIVLFFVIFSSTMSNADNPGQKWLAQIDIYADHPPQRNTALCPPVTIQSVRSGPWNSPSTWDEGRVPSTTDVVLVMNNNFIDGPTDTTLRALCNYGFIRSLSNESLRIVATGFISNNGSLIGRDGESGSGQTCGTSGGSIELSGSVPISNSGLISAGQGGDGKQCVGNGGSVYILGRNTTNTGSIYGGQGGNLTGNITDTIAGRGGDVELWGNWGGPGNLINQGYIYAGNGGDAYWAATVRQHGGCGGDMRLMSQPTVLLDGGVQQSGGDGWGANGGNNGCRGRVTIDPGLISLTGTTVSGGDVIIYGGDDWTLNLRNLNGNAISASGNITLAVGSGGTIDFSGNTSSTQVLVAGGQVLIAADVISQDTGIDLTDLVGTNVVTVAGQILREVSVSGPGLTIVRPGGVKSLNFTVLNGGPAQDTYTLTTVNRAGWSVTAPPSPLIVPGLDGQTLTLRLTVPQSAADGTRNMLTLTLTSSDQVKAQRVEILVKLEKIYLPLIMKK